MKHFFLLLLFITAFSLSAQNWDWVKLADSCLKSQHPTQVETDAYGHVYVVGVNDSTAWYKGTQLDKGSFIAKYTETGHLLWIRNVSGTLAAITCLQNDQVLLAGMFTSTVIIDNHLLSSVGGIDIYLVTLDAAGNLTKLRTFGGPGTDCVQSLETDPFQNTLLTGVFTHSISFDAQSLVSVNQTSLFYLVKFDPQGTALWARTCPYNYANNPYKYSTPLHLALDKRGDAYIAGGYHVLNCPMYCWGYFIVKYASDGTLRYAKEKWNVYQHPYGLAVDDSMNVFVGYHSGSHYTSAKTVAKYDSSLQVKLYYPMGAFGYNTDYTFNSGLTLDQTGNLYSTGIIGEIYYDPVDSVSVCGDSLPNRGECDFAVAKFTGKGKCGWIKTAGGRGFDGFPEGGKIALDAVGNCYVAGVFNATWNYANTAGDTIVFDEDTVVAAGLHQQVFLARIGVSDPILTVIKKAESTKPEIRVFPNPSKGGFSIQLNKNKAIQLRINDLMGNCVYEENCEAKDKIDLQLKVASGVYVLEVKSETEKIVKKVAME